MEIGTLILSIGGLAGALSTTVAFVILIVKPIRNKFVSWVSKTADTDNINKKIDRLTELVETTIEQNKELQAEIEKLGHGLQSSLRNSILNLYYKCMARGSITMFEKQNLMEMYDSYTDLKGNHFIKDCYESLCLLPVKD